MTLVREEQAIIEQIENTFGKQLERVDNIQPTRYGYTEKDGYVTSISLCYGPMGITDYWLVSKFEKLAELYLRDNRLTHHHNSWLGHLTNLSVLDLSSNQIQYFPMLESLTTLETLHLGHNQIEDICILRHLKGLRDLNLSGNKIEDISWLKNLTNLRKLNLSYNKIKDISALENLKNLTELDLSSNRIENIYALVSLTNLSVLRLGENQIHDLSGLEQLVTLTKLDLHSNQITDFSTLGKLTNLIKLDLCHTPINDLSMLGKLTNLERLFLGDTQITEISVLKELSKLKVLHLGNNQITDFSILECLKQLSKLNLSNTGLCDLSALEPLTNLTELYLKNNQITDVSELGQLTKLRKLDLCNNQLRRLPAEFLKIDIEINGEQYHDFETISVWGNPLEDPPLEIIKQGSEAVRNYFDSLETAKEKGEEAVRLYEAKLLVVGPGGVGKTFLSNRLIYGKTPPTETTEGIDIHRWMIDTTAIKDFRVNLWDFGGQEIYHATHQFFLTKRSLYLFVWEARKDDDRVSFGYWLNVIKLLSDNAPVIMVMNKCDERRKAIDQAAIQKQFPNVIGFYEVSAQKDIGIDGLRFQITEEMEALELIGTTLPKQWVDIRRQLEGMKEAGENFISYHAYVDLCRDEHQLNETQAGHLADYYHELGVILHFSDNPVLRDIVFLNPEWATDAVYAVTDYQSVKANHGRFHFNTLKDIWKNYPEDKYAAFLELMMKFELCFNLEGTQEYIIPELLRPYRSSFGWNKEGNLHFQYKYDFMPAGIVTRLMVRKHELIKNELHWKNGAVMEREGTEVLIEANVFEGTIDLWIRGEDTKGMLEIIRCDIDRIHETLNRPNVTERMPCICEKCQESDRPYFYNYHDLRTILRENVRSIRCMKSAKEISIDDLLRTYGMREEERERYGKDRGGTHIYYGDHVEGSKYETKTTIERMENVTQEKVININGSTINAPLVVADQIENSFNAVEKSDTNDEVKALLKQLIQEVNEAAKTADKETAESMGRDVEALSQEVTSSKPRRKWYEMSIEGLKEAAVAVGEVGKPILETTAKLLPVLNRIFR